MRSLRILALATTLPLLAAHPARAQRTAGVSAVTTTRGNVAYTGLHVHGLPRPAADGTPRWADYPVVGAVEPGSPAARVGVAPGDVLVLVNGADARDPRTLFGAPGKVFTLRVRRAGHLREFVVASERPPQSPRPSSR
jgi:C-terminal processing protease CtpA/Prc